MCFTGERRVVYRIAKGALVLLFATVILGGSASEVASGDTRTLTRRAVGRRHDRSWLAPSARSAQALMPARADESRIACQTFYGSQACGPGIRQRAFDLVAELQRNAGGRSFLTSISRRDDRTIAPHAPSAWAMRSS